MNSLIDFDGVGEVLVNLTNKLADAAGWIANRQTPYKIAVDTYIEEIKRSNLDSLTKACLISNAKKIIKEYSNQNEIFAIATESICETAKPNMVENDWVSQFMDKAKLISDREFQLIWGRILAEECNCPNSIPKMLLHILEQMDKNDATAFSLICSFAVWMKDDENKIEYYPIIDSLQLEKF